MQWNLAAALGLNRLARRPKGGEISNPFPLVRSLSGESYFQLGGVAETD